MTELGIGETNTRVQTPLDPYTAPMNPDVGENEVRQNWEAVREREGTDEHIDQGIADFTNRRAGAAGASRAALDKRRARLELNRDRTLEDSGRAEIRRLREARQGFSARGTGRSGFEQRKLGEISSDAELKRSRMLADLKEVFDGLDKRRAGISGKVDDGDIYLETERLRREWNK
tara:strand:+ start:290 stop:814 length:525 start_codon:yes stop_codon:yes gene_type:complete